MDEFELDANLEAAVEEVDLFLAEFCIKYKTAPILTSSILLARLAQLNRLSNSMHDFGKLLDTITTKIENQELEPTKGMIH